MIEIGIGLLIAGVSYALHKIFGRTQFWEEKRENLQQSSENNDNNDYNEYIKQLEKMDAKYHPEKPDVEIALRCKEYLFQRFPCGINNHTQNMSKEELLGLFETIITDAQQLMDVNIGKIDFYSTEEAPYCGYLGYHVNSDNSVHINIGYLLSENYNYVEELVYTIFHELKHARQWAAIVGKLNNTKDYGYSDEQIKIWAENYNNYIPNYVNDELYRKQPLEFDAYGFVTLLKGERQFEIIS